MKRIPILLATLLALILVLAGCSGGGEETAAPAEGGASGTNAVDSGVALPEGFDAMDAAGPGESAAAAALPAALESATEMLEGSGQTMPDLSGAEPRFVAYIIRVELGDQMTLFEVHADGEVHNLYAYRKPFDSGTLIWTPLNAAQSPNVAPQSEPEKAAVAAVEAAMQAEFEESMRATVEGYRFIYVKDESALFSLEIGPEGNVISSSTTPF